MGVPKGFRTVTFDLQSPDGKDHWRVSCLVCDICQAMILQNVPQDFAHKHTKWHENEAAKDEIVKSLGESAKKLQDIYDAAAVSGTKESLSIQAD